MFDLRPNNLIDARAAFLWHKLLGFTGVVENMTSLPGPVYPISQRNVGHAGTAVDRTAHSRSSCRECDFFARTGVFNLQPENLGDATAVVANNNLMLSRIWRSDLADVLSLR